MRFYVQLELDNDNISKDKNRIILSLLKHCFEAYNKEYFNDLYINHQNKIKEFSFSMYMPECKFLKEEILIPSRFIKLFFTAYNPEDGIMFYNSILNKKNKIIKLKDNSIKITQINMIKEKTIFDNEITFKTLSPIVIREHKGDNKKTWYHSLNTEKGQELLKHNLKYNLEDVFGKKVLFDFNDLTIKVLHNKDVKVKYYGIEILSNITKLKIEARPYILEYLYKAGVGSKRASGFGMMDII